MLGKAGASLTSVLCFLPHRPLCVCALVCALWQDHRGRGAVAGSPPLRLRKAVRLKSPPKPVLQKGRMRPREPHLPCQPYWGRGALRPPLLRPVQLLLRDLLVLSGVWPGASRLPGGRGQCGGQWVLCHGWLHQGSNRPWICFPLAAPGRLMPWARHSPLRTGKRCLLPPVNGPATLSGARCHRLQAIPARPRLSQL